MSILSLCLQSAALCVEQHGRRGPVPLYSVMPMVWPVYTCLLLLTYLSHFLFSHSAAPGTALPVTFLHIFLLLLSAFLLPSGGLQTYYCLLCLSTTFKHVQRAAAATQFTGGRKELPLLLLAKRRGPRNPRPRLEPFPRTGGPTGGPQVVGLDPRPR